MRARLIPAKSDITALIYASDSQLGEPEVSRAVRVLSEVGQVLNVADENAARQEFATLSELATH